MAFGTRTSVYDLPVEIFEDILRLLPTAEDILNVALASHACYNSSLPILYRTANLLVGATSNDQCSAARRAVRHMLARPELFDVMRSLRITEKTSDPDSDLKLPWTWPSPREAPAQPRKSSRGVTTDYLFPRTFEATNYTMSILPNFTGLRELTLRSITLPRTFFSSIHILSDRGLRKLVIRSCRLSTRYPPGLDPATLQIQELTLLQVVQWQTTSVVKIKAILKLARAQTLHTLRFDRSLECALNSYAQFGVPRSLQTLICDFRGSPLRGRRPFEALFKFLNSCHHVRDLKLADMGKMEGVQDYSPAYRLLPTSLPELSSITAPLSYLPILAIDRPLQRVSISDILVNHPPSIKYMKIEEIAESLKLLRSSRIELDGIQFNLKDWDREVIYMLGELSPKIKEIRISFCDGDVTDKFYMSLGNLIEFPCLEILHLYRFGDEMASCPDSVFDEQKQYFFVWQLHMPKLREIALAPDVIWLRSRGPKPGWYRETIKRMEGSVGLIAYNHHS